MNNKSEKNDRKNKESETFWLLIFSEVLSVCLTTDISASLDSQTTDKMFLQWFWNI